jgi:hypothetical protein
VTNDNTPWTTTRNSEAPQCTPHGQTKHPRPDRKVRNASHSLKATLLHTDDATTTVQYAYCIILMFCFAIFHILGWEPNMSQCNVHPYTSTACHHACQHRGGLCVFLCIAAGSLSCHYVGVRSQVLRVRHTRPHPIRDSNTWSRSPPYQ